MFLTCMKASMNLVIYIFDPVTNVKIFSRMLNLWSASSLNKTCHWFNYHKPPPAFLLWKYTKIYYLCVKKIISYITRIINSTDACINEKVQKMFKISGRTFKDIEARINQFMENIKKRKQKILNPQKKIKKSFHF